LSAEIKTHFTLFAPPGDPSAAKGARPEDFVDSSFVKKVDDEGLFERLYKR